MEIVKSEKKVAVNRETGQQIAVEFWSIAAAGVVVGYGLLDEAMQRLDPSLWSIIEATGAISTQVEIVDGKAHVVFREDGRLITRLNFANADGTAITDAKMVQQ